MSDESLPLLSGWSRQHVFALLLLISVLSLAGCSLVFGTESTLPTGEEAAESYRSLDGYSATAHIEQSDDPDRRIRIHVDPDDGNSRVNVLEPPHEAGNIYVTNGSTIVRYNETKNEYATISTAGLDRFERGAQRIEDAIVAAREGGKTSDSPPVGGAPLPVVPEAGNGSGGGSAQFVVSFEGTEQIAGREAYKIAYEAAGDRTQGVVEQTVWVDTEHFVTLKATQVSRFDGNRSTYTFRLSNVTFEPGFESGHFEFDPPAGATQNESESFSQQTYDTRTALVEAAGMAVPDPAVPARFSLVSANHIRGTNFTAVQLRYRASTSRIFVTKTTEQSYTNLTAGEAVSLGDRTGRFRTAGTRALVVWECEDRIYTVVGNVPKQVLLDIARSVACP